MILSFCKRACVYSVAKTTDWISEFMDYKEWSSLKTGDRVKRFLEGKGVINASCGVGYIVQFDNETIKKISDGNLHKVGYEGTDNETI